MYIPLALPAAFGYILQWWVQTVCVVANVTIITEQQAPGVTGLPTCLTHCALQTAPAFTQHHFCDLKHTHTYTLEVKGHRSSTSLKGRRIIYLAGYNLDGYKKHKEHSLKMSLE